MFQLGSGGNSGAKSIKRSKLPPYDFQILEGWYQYASRNKQSNLVVVLQDIETFEAQVLQDFISICSEYRRRLPIVFVMGIATSSEILHQSLTKASISLLRVEKFWLEQSEVWLNRVLETLFIERADTLKFGPRPFRFLVDHFYLYDFSMGKVTASLKYALMHHFYANPLSILLPLLGYDAERLKSTLTEWFEQGILCTHHATFLRMLPSFRMHVNALADQDPHEALCLLDDDAYLMTKALPKFVLGLQNYQHHFRYGIELIRILHQQFPDITGLRKPKRELLRMALESDTAALGEAIRLPADLLRKCEGDKLRRFLHQMHAVTMQFSHEEQGESGGDNNNMTLLESWIERLQQSMDAEITKAQESAMKRREKKLDAMVTDTTRHTVTAKKVQDESVKYLKKTGTDKTKIAMEVADWISRTLNKCLMQSINTVPMYELAYYTNVRLHEKSFSAQPRASVQTGLGQAHHYLNCSCCTRPDHVMPSEHDTCILYKLYLECGRMINLYDWFVAFGCILEREKRTERLDEKEVQARFVRSVAELQFLGFIKSTQRKTDHVQRLTWSNV
ncbi:hypothetical protein K492DRAFT_134816 [Lichtheimia hyalospora FSU 10163]|nr:hypothetical protein K492DRAFT_134816 [Lichtheimia hyalospora FSU 10163]